MKVCTTCGTNSTCKWFSGPTCRKCYRQKPENRSKELLVMKAYKKANRDAILAKKKEWRDKNKAYQMSREKVDVIFKLKRRLRTRLHHALKGEWRTGSAVRDLGCSINELKSYFELQFEDWMRWENWGPYDPSRMTWHIDHIVPLDSFDLSKPEELKKACHYTNLRPVLAKENLSKGSKNALRED